MSRRRRILVTCVEPPPCQRDEHDRPTILASRKLRCGESEADLLTLFAKAVYGPFYCVVNSSLGNKSHESVYG